MKFPYLVGPWFPILVLEFLCWLIFAPIRLSVEILVMEAVSLFLFKNRSFKCFALEYLTRVHIKMDSVLRDDQRQSSGRACVSGMRGNAKDSTLRYLLSSLNSQLPGWETNSTVPHWPGCAACVTLTRLLTHWAAAFGTLSPPPPPYSHGRKAMWQIFPKQMIHVTILSWIKMAFCFSLPVVSFFCSGLGLNLKMSYFITYLFSNDQFWRFMNKGTLFMDL